MAKTHGPLYSLSAKGTIGKTITYGKSQFGNWARGVFLKKTTRNKAQDIIRNWFKRTIDYFLDMADEERFLWKLVLMNTKEYNTHKIQETSRSPRCHLSHHTLSTKSFLWNLSPFPPELIQWLGKDEIEGYEQMKSDLETLTGLSFCDPVPPFFFPYLGIVTTEEHPGKSYRTIGLTNARGAAIALHEDHYFTSSIREQKHIVGHELTHAIMSQHGWKYRPAVSDSEIIADECGYRIADGDLIPVYTYKGKTLSEWVPDPSCP